MYVTLLAYLTRNWLL